LERRATPPIKVSPKVPYSSRCRGFFIAFAPEPPVAFA